MAKNPILIIGGAGAVGRWAARLFRAAQPDHPLLIGGRDTGKAQALAEEIGHAQGVAIDMARDDLGLGTRAVGAVAVLFVDPRVAGLRFAQARGVPYLNIAPMLTEMAPEVAAYMVAPEAAPVVLATEWLVGATTIPTLEIARGFATIDAISIGALLDDEDTGGPAQAVDLERITKMAPAALAVRKGEYVWLTGDEAKAQFCAIDGRAMAAAALSPHDVLALSTMTGAPNIAFNLATGETSSRRRGEPMSTEIIIEVSGRDESGQPKATRHAVMHPEGQFPLTGLGVALLLERLTGADGRAPPPPGLYFPSQVIDHDSYRERLAAIGGMVRALEG